MGGKTRWGTLVLAGLLLGPGVAARAGGEEAAEARLTRLERELRAVRAELESGKEAEAGAEGRDPDRRGEWYDRFTLGGYGEVHATGGTRGTNEQIDLHRLVVAVGYEFNDWIGLDSEYEIEHGFIEDGNGELAVEQACVNFQLTESLAVRAGRFLTPVGLINSKHEPPSFNGVERPSFASVIIPTTWSSDGIGISGRLHPGLKYELDVVGGLDGSQFSATNGIRGGRQEERPGLNQPAVTGRLDWFPLVTSPAAGNAILRLGLSAYGGGVNNGNQGNDPDLDGAIRIYAADLESSLGDFDLRGEVAWEKISGAVTQQNGVAEEIFGWYVEGGYHFWPEGWKRGKLVRSDAVVFVRYDDYNTQHKMAEGIAANPAGDRNETTMGISFYPIPTLVVKGDYRIRNDGTTNRLDDLWALGVGWQF